MMKINNLNYALEINYINNLGLNVSIFVKFHDNGLEIKSIKLGDVCITEETIKGRVLSGKFEDSNEYCGYRYDYKKGGMLLNLNPQISIDEAVSLINKKGMESDFLSAQLVLSSILRNDYRVVILNEGRLKIIKTISALNDKSECCCLQESVDLLKLDGEESFVEQSKKTTYKIGDKCVVVETQTMIDCDDKSQFDQLANILSQNPQNYKELIKFKNQIQKTSNINLINEVKTI